MGIQLHICIQSDQFDQFDQFDLNRPLKTKWLPSLLDSMIFFYDEKCAYPAEFSDFGTPQWHVRPGHRLHGAHWLSAP